MSKKSPVGAGGSGGTHQRSSNLLSNNFPSVGRGGDSTLPVAFLKDTTPLIGAPVEEAEGIWSVRLPIPLSMDHINVYLLDGDEGWTLIDAGTNTDECRQTLLDALDLPPFSSKPVDQVLITHFHPDHVGLAGYFTSGKHRDHQARLLTTRTCWHTSQLLLRDDPPVPCAEHLDFVARLGMTGMELESFKRRKPGSYVDNVLELPSSYVRLQEGQQLKIGRRVWTVYVGNGHADEHIVLLSDDNIAVVGDQVLPSISPNLSVHYSEPGANSVGDWIESCLKFRLLLDEKTICLPGHNRSFTGAPRRCQQLIENCHQVISRIEKALSKPKTGIEIMPDIYRRELRSAERNALIGETAGYLNFMLDTGQLKRRLSRRGSYLWRCTG